MTLPAFARSRPLNCGADACRVDPVTGEPRAQLGLRHDASGLRGAQADTVCLPGLACLQVQRWVGRPT